MRPVLVALVGVLLFVSDLRAQGEAVEPSPTFKSGARISARVDTPGGDPDRWYAGIATWSMSGCGLLVLDDLPSVHAGPDGTVLVPYEGVVSIRLSSLYDGHIDPETYHQRNYHRGKPLDGETWIEIPVDSLKAADPPECSRD